MRLLKLTEEAGEVAEAWPFQRAAVKKMRGLVYQHVLGSDSLIAYILMH